MLQRARLRTRPASTPNLEVTISMARNNKDQFGQRVPPALDNATTAFRLGMLPIRTRKPGYARRTRMLAWGLPLVLVALLAGSLWNTYQSAQTLSTLRQQVDNTYNPGYKVKYDQLGLQIVNNWYLALEPVVPYSSTIQWPGQPLVPSQVVKPVTTGNAPQVSHVVFVSGYRTPLNADAGQLQKTPGFSANAQQEVLTYYMVYNGASQLVSLSLAVPDTGATALPVLVSPPTLQPSDQVGTVPVTNNPVDSHMKTADVSTAVKTSVTNWAKAWTANDGDSLKQLAKDNSSAVYRGLGGVWTYDGTPPQSVWAYQRYINAGATMYYVMEVSFTITQQQVVPGTGSTKQDRVTTYSVTQVMDLLIGDTASGLPSVLSWGPAGSWSTLAPNSVALPSSAATQVQPSVSVSSYTPAPSTSGSGSATPSTERS